MRIGIGVGVIKAILAEDNDDPRVAESRYCGKVLGLAHSGAEMFLLITICEPNPLMRMSVGSVFAAGISVDFSAVERLQPFHSLVRRPRLRPHSVVGADR